MAQKNILNKVKTESGYDTLYPLTPYQIYSATSVTYSSNKYSITIPLPAAEITAPILVAFSPNATNSAACTVSVNGLSAYAIRSGGVYLVQGALSTSLTYIIRYDVVSGTCSLIASTTGSVAATQDQAIAATDNSTHMTPLRTSDFYTNKKATQAQAAAGTNDTNYMTPLKTGDFYANQKATQAQAEAGSDDTKYMTPQKTKAQIDVFKGVTYTGINLSTSQNTTINLSTYATNKVRRIDIVINAMFSRNSHIVMNGTNIRVGYGGKDGYGSSDINLGDQSFGYAVAVLSIYLDSNTYSFMGQGAWNNISEKFNVYEFGTFESLTSIVFGAKYDSDNFDTQVGIYQYLK